MTEKLAIACWEPVQVKTNARPCVKCGIIFSGKNCKACQKSRNAAYRAANPEKVKAAVSAWRAANVEKIKIYEAENSEKTKSRKKAYRAANRLKLLADGRERAAKARAKDPQKYIEKCAAWREKNPEKVRAFTASYYESNREELLKKSAKWRSENRQAVLIWNQNRRAKKKMNGGTLSKNIREKLFKLQKGKCACCKQPLGDDYHLDHILPLALGGLNSDDNAQLLTARCNTQKGMKHPIEFMQSRGLLL